MFEERIYATWTEYDGTSTQVRVAVYNGDDAVPAWRFVDGGKRHGLNHDKANRAYRPQLTAYGDKLYAAWNEDDRDGISQLRMVAYNGDDRAPVWSFVDGDGEKGLSADPRHPAVDPQLTVFRSSLYLVWKQLISVRGQKARVMVGR